MGSSKYVLLLCLVVLQGQNALANPFEKNIIATLIKTISKCQLELPPEERNITVQIKCIGTETEDGQVEELNKKQMALRFGMKQTKICGRMTSIECEDEPPTEPQLTEIPSTTVESNPTTPPSLPTQPVFNSPMVCVDIIFVIDVSCTVVKQYQRQAIEIIKRFIKELKFKDDEPVDDPIYQMPVFRIPFGSEPSETEGAVDQILQLMSAISPDQQGISNVAVVPFHAKVLNTTIPFQNNRSHIEQGLENLLKYDGICKTYGDAAYNKAAELFGTIPKRDRNVVIVFGDGRNTGTKHQALSEEAMRKLKNKQNADVIWIITPTKILKNSKTDIEQVAEIISGQKHIERHVTKSQIFDINDEDINTKLMEHLSQNYLCDN